MVRPPLDVSRRAFFKPTPTAMILNPRLKQVCSALAVLSPFTSLWAISANNNYASATVLNGNNFSDTVDVTGNNKQSGEASHGGVSIGGKSAWWSWTPASTGVYQIDTAGSVVTDTLLAIYVDAPSYPTSAAPYATLVTQNNDVDTVVKTSSCRIRAVAGTTYKIAIDTVSNTVGLVTLNIAPASGVPSNDEQATAEPITGIGVITHNGTTVGASANAADPLLHFERGHQPTAWYSYTPSSDRIAKITVTAPAAYAPEFGVFDVSGNRLGGPFPVSMTAGTTYYIAVSGVVTTSGIILNGSAFSQQGTFTIKIETESLAKSVIMPAGQTWEWLHPLTGSDPTTDPNWSSSWKIQGNTATAPAWNSLAPAPFGYASTATGLMVDLAPGAKTSIGTPVPTPASDHAAYFRRKFTLTAPVSRLLAKILADDGAYIYIDNLPGVPVNIRTTASVPDADAFLTSACQAANSTATETSLKDVDLTGILAVPLAAGVHTIAVSLHQASSTGSDGGFDLQLLETKVSVGTQLADLGSIETGFQEPAAGAKTFTRSAAQKELNWKITTDVAENAVAPAPIRGSVRAETDIVDSTTPANSPAFQIAGSTNKFLMTRGLRFTTGSPAGFTTTENIDVNGISKFSVSCKVRAFTTSGTGFENTDDIRVFLETSSDGTTFDGTMDILPLTAGGDIGGTDPILNATGPGALNTPYLDWRTHSLTVTANTAKAVRFRMVGGTDSTGENILLDDVRFSMPNPRVLLTAPVVVRENFNNDNPADDVFTVSTTITGDQLEPSTGWTTTSVGAPSPTSGTYGSSDVTFGPFPVSEGNKTIFIKDSGNPLVSAALFGVPPVTIVTAVANGEAVLNTHGTPANTADDTVDLEVLVNATFGSTGWTIPVSPGTNGTYGVPQLVSVPFASNPAIITIADRAEPSRTGTLSLFFLKMGTVSSNGTPNGLIASHIPSGATAIQWYNSTPTVLKHDGNALQVFTSGPIALPPGGSDATFAASLYANEVSTGSNFEPEDNIKIELLLIAADTSVSTLNLVELNTNTRPSDGLSYDRNANGLYNGYNATDLTLDEFNGNQVAWGLPGGSAEITIPIGYNFNTTGYVTARVRVTGGCNGSTSEHFTLSAMTFNYTSAESDSDHDGLPDDWEGNFFGTLDQGPGDDPDGDGNSNYTEFLAGFNPTDPAENMRITDITKSGNNLSVTWTSIPGKNYQVRFSPDLQAPWQTMVTSPTVIPGASGTTTATAPIPAPVGVRGFVEVIVVP